MIIASIDFPMENPAMNKFLLAAAALVAAPAFAQTTPVAPIAPIPPMAPGTMTAKVRARADVVARTQRMFAMLDTNHDNVLDQAELVAAHKRWDGPRHAGASDAPAGRMPLDRNAMFDMIDTDHNGALSRDEFARAPMHHGEDAGKEGHHDGMGKASVGMGMGGAIARMWTMADANHDGKVTWQEATDLALAHFDRMDANRDGQLTPDERAAGRAAMGNTRGQ